MGWYNEKKKADDYHLSKVLSWVRCVNDQVCPHPPRSQILLLFLFTEKEASGGAVTLLQMTAREESLLVQQVILHSYHVSFSATEVSGHHLETIGAPATEVVGPDLHVPGWTATSPGQTLQLADPAWSTPKTLAGVACVYRTCA